MTPLTPHFTLEELTASQAASRRGIANTPGQKERYNLDVLACLLEGVRRVAGVPITVSSGYRSPEVNKLVGGAPNSAHVRGLAADINAAGMSPRTLARLIYDSPLQFDQVIFEGTWVHIALAEGPLRREALTAHFDSSGRATYSQGIV